MGRVTAIITVENLMDLWDANRGLIPMENVRRVEVTDALVDTGATSLSLPTRLIAQLGLQRCGSRTVTTTAGDRIANWYQAVKITIQGRDCTADVSEVPDNCPVVIGQVPLELLDFVVDPHGRGLIGNPAHGGVQMLEMY